MRLASPIAGMKTSTGSLSFAGSVKPATRSGSYRVSQEEGWQEMNTRSLERGNGLRSCSVSTNKSNFHVDKFNLSIQNAFHFTTQLAQLRYLQKKLVDSARTVE